MSSSPGPWWAASSDAPPGRVRARRARKALLYTAIVLLGALVIASAAANPGRQPRDLGRGVVEAPPTLQDLASGCSGIKTFPPSPADEIGWIPDEVTPKAWRFLPPVSGNFGSTPYPSRFIEMGDFRQVRVADAVANLYRGWMVVWYLPPTDDIGRTQVEALRAWSATVPESARVLIAPWPVNPVETWPVNKRVVLTSWGMSQSCSEVGREVLDAFLTKSRPSPAPGWDVPLDVPGPAAKTLTSTRLETTS